MDELRPYEKPRREDRQSRRKPISPRSKRPNRVQRRQEGAEHARLHHEAVGYCEARTYGVRTPCGTGLDAILEHSHTIGKGMGGGRDFAATDGECAILCKRHHTEIDTRRADMRAAGLTKRAPTPDKVPPRRSVT